MGRLHVGTGVVVVAHAGGAAFAETEVEANATAQEVLTGTEGADRERRGGGRIREARVEGIAIVGEGVFVGDVQGYHDVFVELDAVAHTDFGGDVRLLGGSHVEVGARADLGEGVALGDIAAKRDVGDDVAELGEAHAGRQRGGFDILVAEGLAGT